MPGMAWRRRLRCPVHSTFRLRLEWETDRKNNNEGGGDESHATVGFIGVMENDTFHLARSRGGKPSSCRH